MTRPVLDAVVGHLRREAEVGAPVAASEAGARLEAIYPAVARLLGAEADEIALVESGNRGLQALIASVRLQPGDRVLIDRACWGGLLTMLASFKGVQIDVMPVDIAGCLDLAAMRAKSDARTRLVLLTWCPATNGLINPAAAVGAFAAEIGATYLIDACQALGQLPVNVGDLGCHGLAASGRKWLRGPRGTAILYASRAFLAATEPFMADQFGAQRTDARRYETGEAFIAGRLGLGAAVDGVLALGVDAVRSHIGGLADRLRRGLSAIPGALVHDRGDNLSGIVTFGVESKPAPESVSRLAARGVTMSAIPAFYTPLDMAGRGLTELVRAAPHMFTKAEDIDAALGSIEELTP